MKKVKRKEPVQARSASLVEAVVEATRQVAGTDGIDAVTVKRIAERAGVSPGSIYQYFPSKDALVAVWEEWEFSDGAARFCQMLADQAPLGRRPRGGP